MIIETAQHLINIAGDRLLDHITLSTHVGADPVYYTPLINIGLLDDISLPVLIATSFHRLPLLLLLIHVVAYTFIRETKRGDIVWIHVYHLDASAPVVSVVTGTRLFSLVGKQRQPVIGHSEYEYEVGGARGIVDEWRYFVLALAERLKTVLQ